MPTFGERIKELRKAKGITLNEASARSGGALSRTGILRIEANERDPLLSSLEAIAHGIDIEIRINPRGVYIEPWEEN